MSLPFSLLVSFSFVLVSDVSMYPISLFLSYSHTYTRLHSLNFHSTIIALVNYAVADTTPSPDTNEICVSRSPNSRIRIRLRCVLEPVSGIRNDI